MRYRRCGDRMYKLCLRKTVKHMELEQMLVSGLMGFGTQAVGFLFLYFFMKHYFLREKEHDDDGNKSIKKQLDDLTEKVDDARELRKTFEHLDTETSKQTKLLLAICKTLTELVQELHTVNVAVKKGYIDENQARDIMSEEEKGKIKNESK